MESLQCSVPLADHLGLQSGVRLPRLSRWRGAGTASRAAVGRRPCCGRPWRCCRSRCSPGPRTVRQLPLRRPSRPGHCCCLRLPLPQLVRVPVVLAAGAAAGLLAVDGSVGVPAVGATPGRRRGRPPTTWACAEHGTSMSWVRSRPVDQAPSIQREARRPQQPPSLFAQFEIAINEPPEPDAIFSSAKAPLPCRTASQAASSGSAIGRLVAYAPGKDSNLRPARQDVRSGCLVLGSPSECAWLGRSCHRYPRLPPQ